MKKLDICKLQENVPELIGKQWMLITAGTPEKYNMMTGSWGMIGFMWGKPVACAVIRPQRYTYKFVEKEDCFTLSFFDEKYRDALKICGSKSGRDLDKAQAAGLTSFSPDGGDCVSFEEARLILKCRKLYSGQMSQEAFIDKSIPDLWYKGGDFHQVYIAEITEAWEI